MIVSWMTLASAMLVPTCRAFSSVPPHRRRPHPRPSSASAATIGPARPPGVPIRGPPTGTATATPTPTAMGAASAAASSSTSSIPPPEAAPPRADATFSALFDFSLSDPRAKARSASSFERIDDAIMGGISRSRLRDVPDSSHATWSGACRTDGGGFCGMRTLPFPAPLDAAGADGVFVVCRLASDDEARRRVWKVTLRTEEGRGERVYQAEYDLGGAMDEAERRWGRGRGGEEEAGGAAETDHDDDNVGWARVMVPFDDFRMVRGPRLVPDGPRLDVSGGIHQIGMTLSKFRIAANTTEIENFRPGYFELQIRRIGFYRNLDASDGAAAAAAALEVVGDVGVAGGADGGASVVPDTLSEEESARRRPLLLRMLLPAARLFFSEGASRRRRAMRLLREDRRMSRLGAIALGMRYRRRGRGAGGSMGGMLTSACETARILGVDAFRAVVGGFFRVGVVYPVRLVGAIANGMKRMAGGKTEPSLRE